jgi:hypothetical protein
MPRHLLFFGKLLNLSVSFLLFFCGADVICKQSAACAFKKISFIPRTIGESNVKGAFLSAFEPGNNFLGRGDKAKGTRQIVGCPERENTQRNAAIDEPVGDLCSGPITAGSKYEIGGLLESFLETAVFCRLIGGVMPSFSQRRHQLLASMLGVASLWIMHQGDSHVLLIRNLFGQNQSHARFLLM